MQKNIALFSIALATLATLAIPNQLEAQRFCRGFRNSCCRPTTNICCRPVRICQPRCCSNTYRVRPTCCRVTIVQPCASNCCASCLSNSCADTTGNSFMSQPIVMPPLMNDGNPQVEIPESGISGNPPCALGQVHTHEGCVQCCQKIGNPANCVINCMNNTGPCGVGPQHQQFYPH